MRRINLHEIVKFSQKVLGLNNMLLSFWKALYWFLHQIFTDIGVTTKYSMFFVDIITVHVSNKKYPEAMKKTKPLLWDLLWDYV